MTISDFCTKYNLPTYEKQGLKEASKFWARENFEEKLLVLIYVLTFGSYPGGIDGSLDDDIQSTIKNFIDDSAISTLKTWSSAKIKASIQPIIFEFREPSVKWVVTHNLGTFPKTSIIVNNEVVWADCIYLSENSLEINFTNPQMGKVIL